MDPHKGKGICTKAMVTKAFSTWQLPGKGQGPTIRPTHMSRNGGKLKGEKGTGLPAPGSLATAQGSYEDGIPSTPTRSSRVQEGLWLSLVPQESLGFFTLCLQGLTCIFLEQFHFLPPYKRLLDLLL